MKISPQQQKELRIKQFLEPYETKFEVVDAAIDLRTMAKNYKNELIPALDIMNGISAVLGEPHIDEKNKNEYIKSRPKLYSKCPVEKIFLCPAFQRDVSPTHVQKIERAYDNDIPSVIKCIKHPMDDIFSPWDDSHTFNTQLRKGFTEFDVLYVDIGTIEGESYEDATKRMIKKAGHMFLQANDTNKRKLSRYDKHMVALATFQTDAVIVQRIVDACDVKIKRASKNAGEISHVKHVYDLYDLKDPDTHKKSAYMARTLKFYRRCYPKQVVDPILMLCIGQVFANTHMETMQPLPTEFEEEFIQILRNIGSGAKVQSEIKKSYIAYHGGEASHPVMVYSGLIHLINKYSTKDWMLGAPISHWEMNDV